MINHTGSMDSRDDGDAVYCTRTGGEGEESSISKWIGYCSKQVAIASDSSPSSSQQLTSLLTPPNSTPSTQQNVRRPCIPAYQPDQGIPGVQAHCVQGPHRQVHGLSQASSEGRRHFANLDEQQRNFILIQNISDSGILL